MLDIEAVKQCYTEYNDNYLHYEKIDMYYYANVDEMKTSNPVQGRSKAKVVDNFFQGFVDKEALYSFGNAITYSYNEKLYESIADVITENTNNKMNHDSSLGQRLIEFGLVYELNFIGKYGFKSKIVTPMQGNMFYDDYDEEQFFIYVHSKNGVENYIDVYDDKYVYYLNPSYVEYMPKKEHGFSCIPVGVGMIGNNKYSIKKGYVEGDKTIYRMVKSNQDAYSQTKSCMTQEIIDFRNAILKTYGIKLKDKVDEKTGKPILDSHGQPLKEEPVLNNTKMLHFRNKKESDAEWLIKDINDTFIMNILKVFRDDMHTLTCHVDCNEKMQSNLSGQALRARLQALESKCTQNSQAMHDIIITRLRCLFDYLSTIRKGDYDYKKVKVEFTVCIPIDDGIIADMISKIPHEVVSNFTKRSWLPKVNNPKKEQDIIDEENKADPNDVNLDKVVNKNG